MQRADETKKDSLGWDGTSLIDIWVQLITEDLYWVITVSYFI